MNSREYNAPAVESRGVAEPLATGAAPKSYSTRPREGTKAARVLEALEAGQSLTAAQGYSRFGSMRLAAIVHQLRRRGCLVITEEKHARDRYGYAVRYAEYSMPTERTQRLAGGASVACKGKQ